MTSDIEAMLREEPYSFGFFQAVRLLERLYPDRQPVGKFASPTLEVVRFGVHTSLTFPPSEIRTIRWEDGFPPQMIVNFMGLTGPSGVLPDYYTELIASRAREGDRAMRDFLDIFNHRLISLFYRAWAKHHFSVAFDSADSDRFSMQLLSLIGMGTPGLQERQEIKEDSFIYYAGLLARHARSASDLKQIIADYFEIPAEIEEFAGSWCRLDETIQTCLGEMDSDSSVLGFGAVVGDEVWLDDSSVRIILGPLPRERYLQFLPGERGYKELAALTRFFRGDELDFEIRLLLIPGDAPGFELGATGTSAPRLGWFSWLKSGTTVPAATETILHL
jgi:type VI secretion system protein ImpH